MNSSYVLIRIHPFRKTRIRKNRTISCPVKNTEYYLNGNEAIVSKMAIRYNSNIIQFRMLKPGSFNYKSTAGTSLAPVSEKVVF